MDADRCAPSRRRSRTVTAATPRRARPRSKPMARSNFEGISVQGRDGTSAGGRRASSGDRRTAPNSCSATCCSKPWSRARRGGGGRDLARDRAALGARRSWRRETSTRGTFASTGRARRLGSATSAQVATPTPPRIRSTPLLAHPGRPLLRRPADVETLAGPRRRSREPRQSACPGGPLKSAPTMVLKQIPASGFRLHQPASGSPPRQRADRGRLPWTRRNAMLEQLRAVAKASAATSIPTRLLPARHGDDLVQDRCRARQAPLLHDIQQIGDYPHAWSGHARVRLQRAAARSARPRTAAAGALHLPIARWSCCGLTGASCSARQVRRPMGSKPSLARAWPDTFSSALPRHIHVLPEGDGALFRAPMAKVAHGMTIVERQLEARLGEQPRVLPLRRQSPPSSARLSEAPSATQIQSASRTPKC